MPLSLEELQSIADGDTVRTQQGTSVRLTGFNAPEVAHDNTGVAAEPGAAMSTQLTREYLQQPGSYADVVGQDVYGRTLGTAAAPGGGTLAEEQLRRGLASPMATEGRISDAERRAYLLGLRERRDPSTPEQARINQQLDQEWRGATTNAPNVRKKFKRDAGDTFSDAIDRGLDQIGLMVGGTQRMLGEMTGIDSLVQSGNKRIDDNQRDVLFNSPDIGTMDNVKSVGDGMTYVIEKLGEQGPNLLATIGAAAVTGGTGAALRVGATKLASERLAVQLAADAMGAVGKGMTMTTGAALGAGTLNIGETKLHLDHIAPEGDHNFEALAVGGAKTALDLLSLGQATRGVRRLITGSAAAPMTAKEVGKEIGKSTLLESATEGTQGFLDEAAGRLKYDAPINWQNVTESAAVGAISGAGFSTPMHAGSAALQRVLAPRNPSADPAADPAANPAADPATARAAYDATLARMQELQAQAAALDPDSAEGAAIDAEIQAVARQGLELQRTMQTAEPAGGTTAEPAGDIAAQMAAAADPNHPKPGMWIAGGGMAAARQAREAGLEVVTLDDGNERGLFASADPALRQKLYDLVNAGMPVQQALAENLYNIPAGTKDRAVETAAQGVDVPVVQNVTPDGAVVTEAGAAPEQLQGTQEALATQLGEGETQRIVTASQVQGRRAAQGEELFSQGIRPRPGFTIAPEAPRSGVKVAASGRVDIASDSNDYLMQPEGPFVGPPTAHPGRVGDGAAHIAHRQMAEANADAAMNLQQQLANPAETPANRGTVMPVDEPGNPILETYPPNTSTMVPAQPTDGAMTEPAPTKEPTAVPPGGTLVRYGKPSAPAQRATSLVTGERVQDRITRVAQEGQKRNRPPVEGAPKTGSGVQRLESRLRALPYVKRLMLVASRESSKVKLPTGEKISVAARNNQILGLVRNALLSHLDRVHGIDSPSQREGNALGAKYGALLHQIANHVSDKDLNEFVEAAHNDKRNTLNAVGRPEGASQDRSVGEAQQGRTPQDDDNGRAPAQEEYAGEQVEYEQGFNPVDEDAPARKGLAEFSQNLATDVSEPPLLDRQGKYTGKRWTLAEMYAELRQNPLFANNTPIEIAERFNQWAAKLKVKEQPPHLLAAFVELAHQTYAQRARNRSVYDASSTAARQFEASVNASPELTAEQNRYQRDINDFGVSSDVNNAVDLSPEQAAYDQEQQAERARRGYPPEPVPKTERQVARFRGAVENKVNLDAAENDGLTADPAADPANQNVRTLSELLFADLASVADVLTGLQGRTGQINAQQVVDSLLKNGKPSKVTRLLLGALKPFLYGYQIVFDAEATKPGVINPGTRTITIKSAMRSGEVDMLHVMLHEMVHAATVDALQNNAAFSQEIARLRALAQAHLEQTSVRDAEALQEIRYGLISNDEFVAQLFSSPAFVEFLETATDAADPRRTRTSALKTLFNEVIGALKKALGLADNVTLAAQAMDTVLSELAKGPNSSTSPRGELFAPSIRPTLNAVRSSEPVQRVLNAPQGGKLRALGAEVATGTGRAKTFMARAIQAFLTSDHQLRQILTDAIGDEQVANRIEDRIYVRPGTKGRPGYLQLATIEGNLHKAKISALLERLANEVVDGKKRGKDAAHQLLADAWAETELANANLASRRRMARELERLGEAAPAEELESVLLGPVASELQQVFAELASYIESAGVKGFHRVEGYYTPQIYNKGEVKARFDEFVAAIVGLEYTSPSTGEVLDFTHATASEFANNLVAEHPINSLADLPWSGALKNRTLTDPEAAARLRAAGFMEGNVANIINYHVDSVTKAAEFEREFGGYATNVRRVADPGNPGRTMLEEVDTFDVDHRLIKGTLRGLYGVSPSATSDSVSYRRAIARALRDGVLENTGEPGLYRVWQRDIQFQQDVLGAIRSNQARLRFQAVFSGMQGNLGADMNPQWRRTQQWLLMVESITTLGFSTLSSFVEAGVLAAAQPGFNVFLKAMKSTITDREGAWKLLRDMGLAGEHISHIAMADNGVMRGGEIPQIVMDKFFKLNGQHYWTQFMRAVALQMFKTTAQTHAESGALAEFFDHYGVTQEQVAGWLNDDTPAFSLRVDENGEADPTAPMEVHPVTAAAHRFVDDHVAMPNRANVPAFFNDPRFALLVQLKRFFYAYGSQVIMRMARQAQTTYQRAVARGDSKAAAALVAAYPYIILGAFSLPLAMISRELKDFLKYDAWGEDRPNYNREGMAYWFDALRRTGALGPADLAVSLFDERSGGMESLMGPLVAHLDVGLEHGFFSKEFARRSTPVIGQLNGAWK